MTGAKSLFNVETEEKRAFTAHKHCLVNNIHEIIFFMKLPESHIPGSFLRITDIDRDSPINSLKTILNDIEILERKIKFNIKHVSELVNFAKNNITAMLRYLQRPRELGCLLDILNNKTTSSVKSTNITKEVPPKTESKLTFLDTPPRRINRSLRKYEVEETSDEENIKPLTKKHTSFFRDRVRKSHAKTSLKESNMGKPWGNSIGKKSFSTIFGGELPSKSTRKILPFGEDENDSILSIRN